MPIFALKGDELSKVKEVSFKSEKKMQRLTENNLNEIFGLDFVSTEFSLKNLRIDTLGFDKETNSFVIIEYKKGKNFSVVDQGFAYLSLLLNNKADFVLKYNEQKGKNLSKGDVDWSQSRVIFVTPRFTKYQRRAVDFKDMAFELWEMNRYGNDTVLYNRLRAAETSESIKKVSKKGGVVRTVTREIKVYTEDDHLANTPDDIRELYEEAKERILNVGESIQVVPRKHYIGFKADTNFVDIHPQKSQLKLWINLLLGELDDPRGIARDVSKIGRWGNGDYELTVRPGDDLDYLMTLIRQSYKKHSS
ncbi:MAG: DUF5655 domain-containing protein [Thermoplasmata archaeon]